MVVCLPGSSECRPSTPCWEQIFTPAQLASGRSYPHGFGSSIDSVGGEPLYQHLGQWQGFSAQVSRYVGRDLSILVLALEDLGEVVSITLLRRRELGDERGIAYGILYLAGAAAMAGDPETARPYYEEGARRFERITYLEALQRQLAVMDSTAFSLCMDNKMPIIVFDLFKPHNLRKVVMGEAVGTLVTS